MPAATWTHAAIKEDPAGFIAYAIPRLRANITEAESAQNGLREALETLDRLKQENGEKLASNGAALSAFKESFQAPGREWPLPVAGREYDEAAFMKEVERLLEECRLLVAGKNQVVIAAYEADRQAQFLAMQIQIDRVTIDVLEAWKPMLTKPPLHPSGEAALKRALVGAHERLSKAEEPSDTAAIRSVSELMQAATRKSRLTDAEFQPRLTAAEFLNRKPESRR